MLNAEVLLQLDLEMSTGRVTQRAMGPHGRLAGSYNDDSFKNSMIYKAKFLDGQVREYAANIIAKNMFTQTNLDGYSHTLMDSIVDYKKDQAVAVPLSEKYIVTKQGRRKLRKTTVKWLLLVKWANESETWIPFKDMKEFHPVEMVEFACARDIANKPAFVWWVPHTMAACNTIISKLKARIRKTTHKYGIEIPLSVEHAHAIDRSQWNTLW